MHWPSGFASRKLGSLSSYRDELVIDRERSGRLGWDRFHGEGDAFAGDVDFQHGDCDLLVDLDDRIGIADIPIGQLTDMDGFFYVGIKSSE